MPMTGRVDGPGNAGSLARVNVMREEPGGTKRFFVSDLNGPLYILDTTTKKLTTYLNFNGRGTPAGLFDKLTIDAGFANGFITFQFDPDYTRNGKFYTIHLEDPALPGSLLPHNISGYTPTVAITTPGAIQREAVLIEWTDTNIANSTFEGTARELMRVQLNTRIHPMGDLIFNPTARRGDADWRVLYIGCGDGGSGEQQNSSMRLNPQFLDTLVGKILRIIPDLQEHTDSSTVSGNGRYRIPNDNPFAATAGARKEIWAYGLRNPHRLSWDVELIAAVVGLHTWETVDVIHKGANYGYPLREGHELLKPDNTTGPLPEPDRLPVQTSARVLDGTVAPEYPVIQYPHTKEGGDAIAGGFVYRGKLLPALDGKYVFGDITTGRIWYADYNAMLGNRGTIVGIQVLNIEWNGESYTSMSPIVETAYHARGGKDPDLPGNSTVSGASRVDMRLAMDANGELYILSKSDGMIRAVVGVTASSARN
jgi:glucose/arabinose dehydrogenase